MEKHRIKLAVPLKKLSHDGQRNAAETAIKPVT